MDRSTGSLCDDKTRMGSAAASPISGRGITIAPVISEAAMLATARPMRITSEHQTSRVRAGSGSGFRTGLADKGGCPLLPVVQVEHKPHGGKDDDRDIRIRSFPDAG